MSFEIRPAKRSSVRPLVGFFGRSGGGKTMSALLFARGLVGPAGRVGMIDTENGRGSIFSDVIPGGYKVLNLDPPFGPERYVDAIDAIEGESDVVVIDSMSHSWDGEGGVLDLQEAELQRMAGDNWQRRETCKMAAWIKPKMAAKRMTQRILRSKGPIICCLRALEKTHIEKVDGKTVVRTDDFTTPIMDPRFIFEMLLNFECFAKGRVGGFVNVTKITHHDIGEIMPKDGDQIGQKHGELLAAWCNQGTAVKPVNSAAVNGNGAPDQRKILLTKLRDMTTGIHGWHRTQGNQAWEPAKGRLRQMLWDENLMADTEVPEEMPIDRLAKLVADTEAKLSQGVTP